MWTYYGLLSVQMFLQATGVADFTYNNSRCKRRNRKQLSKKNYANYKNKMLLCALLLLVIFIAIRMKSVQLTSIDKGISYDAE